VGVAYCGATIDETKHLLSVIDAQRAAAGELRGMLEEAVELIGWAGSSEGVVTGDLLRECREFANRPDVVAAIKETAE